MTATDPSRAYDVLVLGAGVGGMESALALGDMGFRVLLVEKEPSVGGRMILLSKVFPTLDCASCISTPKMAAVSNHPNVRTLVSSVVDEITPTPSGGFEVRLTRRPTYVDFAKCTGCALCEPACTVAVPDEFNYDLDARRAAHIAFPQAVPKRAVITREGLSPCSHTCPAGVKPHGYVSLVRAGKFDEAFRQHLEDAPLPGTLSRACYAPCEDQCARAELEGAVSIRGIKRFMVDRYYAQHPDPEYGPPTRTTGKKVAVVGSGPSGLTAAFFLARAGHTVTILEASSAPGGVLRWGIPTYRLPEEVVARDLRNITALGVEVRTRTRVDSLGSLRDYDAVFLAVGATGGRALGAPGEQAEGVLDSMVFLRMIRAGTPPDLAGRGVAVIGGGNVAMDAARSAIRLGARAVHIYYRRSRAEMPAHAGEIREAEEEGVGIESEWAVEEIRTSSGRVAGLDLVRSVSPPGAGRGVEPILDPTHRASVPADVVLLAIGLVPQTSPFATELELGRGGTVRTDPETLATSAPGVYAGGDAVTGPSTIVDAIGQGKRAAFHIDRYLRGLPPGEAKFDERMPMANRASVVARARANATRRPPIAAPLATIEARQHSFAPYEGVLSEDQARSSANRCLDCGVCSDCRACIAACPADAIDLHMRPQHETATVRAVALATGFTPFDARRKPAFGFGRLPNVINGPQMDRILAPTRPFNAVVRPSDGKAPSNVAFVLCAGSRDTQVGNRLCSRVCCMYSMKQAQLLMGALPLADVTLYYLDIRAFGKGYEEFFQQTKGMGVYFRKGKVSRIEPTDGDDLLVHYEDIEEGGGPKVARHDLVVLSVGLLPTTGATALFRGAVPDQDRYDYIREPDEEAEPSRTSVDGVFVVGSATAVRDIPDTIVHAEAAAAQVATYLKRPAGRV